MDPVSLIGLLGSIIGIGDVVTRTVKSISLLQTKFQDVNLHVSLLIGQLLTLDAALRQISDWISSMQGIQQHGQLIEDLTVAFNACKLLITRLDERVAKLKRSSGDEIQLAGKVTFLWEELEIKEYLGLLSNQIAAFNLLLNARQCRTQSEQSALLAKRESRQIFKRVEDDTSSMRLLRDNESALTFSRPTSVSESSSQFDAEFDFDQEIVASKAYQMAMRSNLKLLTLSKKKEKQQQQPLSFDGSTTEEKFIHVPISNDFDTSSDSSDESLNNSDDEDTQTVKKKIDTPPSTAGLPDPNSPYHAKHSHINDLPVKEPFNATSWAESGLPKAISRFWGDFMGGDEQSLASKEFGGYRTLANLIKEKWSEQDALIEELEHELYAKEEQCRDLTAQVERRKSSTGSNAEFKAPTSLPERNEYELPEIRIDSRLDIGIDSSLEIRLDGPRDSATHIPTEAILKNPPTQEPSFDQQEKREDKQQAAFRVEILERKLAIERSITEKLQGLLANDTQEQALRYRARLKKLSIKKATYGGSVISAGDAAPDEA